MSIRVDVLIVGGGPAGATCAAFAARDGLETLLLEKTAFPRDKVCGDCLNPVAWPALQRLGIDGRVLDLPHSVLREVQFQRGDSPPLRVELPQGDTPEIGVRRSLLDELLLQHAMECGAKVSMEAPATAISRHGDGWKVETPDGAYQTRWLVAADGRNSSVARQAGILPSARRDRVGLQTHIPLPGALEGRVVMRFLPWGYCGLADIGGGLANLCLVSRPGHLAALQEWATTEYRIPHDQTWLRTAPLARAPAPAVTGSLLLTGDALRVVEPFTGEGIAYAIRTGELAARAIVAGDAARYAADSRALYRGRVWINRLARIACEYPAAARLALSLSRWHPGILRLLTRKVVSAPRSRDLARTLSR